MPYKFNERRRHKIPKARYRVANWPEYDAALVRRGSLTIWFTRRVRSFRSAYRSNGREKSFRVAMTKQQFPGDRTEVV